MIVPNVLRLATPADSERGLIDGLLDRLRAANIANSEAGARYEGSWLAQQFGISIPPKMRTLHTVAGWCGTVVDVLEERLDWLGWTSEGDDFGLRDVYAANGLDVDSGMAHLDALIFGVSFVSVGSGMAGEPNPLITPHSPESMTATWDRRTRRLSAALAVVPGPDGRIVEVTLYQPDETAVFQLANGDQWRAVDRDQHNLGRLPVVALPNRVRGSRDFGRSEITKAIRYYTDAAARTLLGLEVNREFYNAPQRVGLNVDDSMFEDENGQPVSPWTSIMGRIWNVPPNEEGMPEPKVTQFNPASPAPYIDQVQGYAKLLAGEAGIPLVHLGIETANPTSAEAIKGQDARLVKRAERRQAAFGRSWMEVGRLALLVRDNAVPDTFETSVTPSWRDPNTPTQAAAADAAVKLVGAGVLPTDSSITYDRIGLTPAEQRVLAADKAQATAAQSTDLPR